MDMLLSDGHVREFRSLCRSSIGLGIIWGWMNLFSIGISQSVGLDPMESSSLALIWKVTTALVLMTSLCIAEHRQKKSRPACSKQKLTIASIMGCAGTFVVLLPDSSINIPHFINIISIIFIGFAYGYFINCWASLPQPESMLLNAYRMGLVCIIAAFIFLLLTTTPSWVFAISVSVLPLVACCIQINQSLAHIKELSSATLINKNVFGNPVFLGIGILLFGTALGICSQINSQGPLPLPWTYGSTIAGFILCYYASRKTVTFDIKKPTIVFVLFVCACILLAALSVNNRSMATGVVRIGWFILISASLGLPPYVPMHHVQSNHEKILLGYLSFFFGLIISEILWLLLPGKDLYMLIIAGIASILGTLVVFSNFIPHQSLSSNQNALPEHLVERCKTLGKRGGLTPRELEVLFLLAGRFSVKAISDNLNVSPNTVKTQIRSIYTKFEIHSKQELFCLLENATQNNMGIGSSGLG